MARKTVEAANENFLSLLYVNCSNFSDVFDEDHFINALANDVRVIRKLPEELATVARAVKYFRSWSGMDYYQNEIASMWDEHKVCFE